MFSVSNLSRTNQPFHVKGGKVETLRPGETKSLALLDRNSGHNVGRESVGVIAIADTKASAKAKPTRHDPSLPETSDDTL